MTTFSTSSEANIPLLCLIVWRIWINSCIYFMLYLQEANSESKRYTLQQYIRFSYKVIMYIKSYITFVRHPHLTMAESWAESTWEITNYGRFINQFPPNIRSIRQFERINKKICWQKMSIIFNQKLYIYIFSSYNVWKHVRYHVLISRHPRVITQFR